MSHIIKEKQLLRKKLIKERLSINNHTRQNAAKLVANIGHQKIMGLLSAPGIIAGFYPYNGEINCLPLLELLANSGWTITLPVVLSQGEPLEFRQWNPGENLIKGSWGIPIPFPQATKLIPNLILVPLLAFDIKGYRLGYGGGFYDVTIANLKHDKYYQNSIGVGFSSQKLDKVPKQRHDAKLDYILTELEWASTKK